MRKNAPRKWLHAVLDLLPVILIPVFMIYSHRHEINTYEVQYSENQVINFNQLVPNNLSSYSSTDNIIDTRTFVDFKSSNAYSPYLPRFISQSISTPNTYTFDFTSSIEGVGRVYHNGQQTNYSFLDEFAVHLDHKYILKINFLATNPSIAYGFSYDNFQIFDLTQMFGAGNEPSAQDFNILFPNDYYDYTLGHKELLKVNDVTLNDTDIMSQFTYNLYNSVDKYFNMNNIFGFNNLYDWFVLNVFNGNAPLYVYIVWNIILYEFIMDLLFLLYAVFMFLIDVCTHLIEKVFDSGRGA